MNIVNREFFEFFTSKIGEKPGIEPAPILDQPHSVFKDEKLNYVSPLNNVLDG